MASMRSSTKATQPCEFTTTTDKDLSSVKKVQGKYVPNDAQVNVKTLWNYNQVSIPNDKIQIRGRPGLVGSDSELLPEHIPLATSEFPKIYEASHDTYDMIQTIQEELAKSGAVLFRNAFEGDCEQKPKRFSRFVDQIYRLTPLYTCSYHGGTTAGRKSVNDDVLLASAEESYVSMEGHNEMSYLRNHPTVIMFYCHKDAGSYGGESPTIRNSDIIKYLDPAIIKKFTRLGVKYSRHLADFHRDKGNSTLDAYSWQQSFQSFDRKFVERILKQLNATWKWNEDGSLDYWYTWHATTNDGRWFNQISVLHHSYYLDVEKVKYPDHKIDSKEAPSTVYYGDGSLIEDAVIDKIRAAKWKAAQAVRYKNNDLLVLDNRRVQHGRMSYDPSTNRRVLVAQFRGEYKQN